MELSDLKNENKSLKIEIDQLKKALDKRKELHRKFSDEVIDTE